MEECNNPITTTTMDFPQDFRCPISMELMKEPVTISTGVTYERKNIEKWFTTYQKTTCPATMQCLESFDMTPNHTLMRLITAWRDLTPHNKHPIRSTPLPPTPPSTNELSTLVNTIETTPFKVRSLKKLCSLLEASDHEVKAEFKRLGGVETLVKIITNILHDTSYFGTFRACEEALMVLNQVPLTEEDEEILALLMNPDSMNSMSIVIQRGSAEARFVTVSIFRRLAKADYQWNYVAQEQGIDFFKSLFEIVSDQICNKASSSALELLLEITEASKKSRLKSIQSGAIRTLIELLPDTKSKGKCEKVLQLIKCLCECADGRLAFIEHGVGIAAVTKKMLSVSGCATKVCVKVLWLVSTFHSTERVLEEMLVCGAVRTLVALMHMGGGGGGGTRERVVKMLKMHGRTWRRYPCFPSDVKEYLGLGNESY